MIVVGYSVGPLIATFLFWRISMTDAGNSISMLGMIHNLVHKGAKVLENNRMLPILVQ
ncbi:hypothetical protein PORCRE_1885 [Porphyromonas crevioricanis JCM 15906]|uniref:Uncharacterized protein n=1 Tax=Porphyromonas crevioricanis JCM 15906 TaxID=1305617 RepID=T1CSM3_9PORP|nr:hypothetical protein PORCRE_1885 [Porphyromonas crevioricanis JCM 15906]GAD08562.1 hypothetical protein PORCAN_2210 [Porphyromonas crevioricanis JCM 13913]